MLHKEIEQNYFFGNTKNFFSIYFFAPRGWPSTQGRESNQAQGRENNEAIENPSSAQGRENPIQDPSSASVNPNLNPLRPNMRPSWKDDILYGEIEMWAKIKVWVLKTPSVDNTQACTFLKFILTKDFTFHLFQNLIQTLTMFPAL